MLPPAEVLTNINCGAKARPGLLLAAVVICAGCAPPGPRALLEGKKLVDEGRFVEAVEPLQTATRLLPQNAHGWNYLGLAYHGSGEPEQAVKAYRTALAADHKLSVVRFNLGCLFLEQEQLSPAIDELRSYTLLQPGAVEGWLKLGTAQLRSRRLDEAERSFRSAMELRARNPEALNGMGLIQTQRRRWAEAANYFNVSSLQDPPYAPAVLNLAILNHQHLNNRPAALKHYRQYLALQPRPAEADTVEATVRQLEHEMNPPAMAQRPPAASPPAAALPRSLTPVAPTLSPGRATQLPLATSVRTNPSAPVPSARPTIPTNLIALKPAPEPARPPARPAIATNKTPEPPPTPRLVEVEVTQVQPTLVVKSAQDITPSPAVSPVQIPGEPAVQPGHVPTNSQRRGILARLNPFSGRPKGGEDAAGSVPSAPPVNRGNDALPVSIPRYTYLVPQPPTAGSRAEAEKLFQRGVTAHKTGNRSQAVVEYQAAVTRDPAYFDAYYNLGLAALDSGDVRVALWACELALSLKPGSADARYNFALVLKAGGYLRDAADQLHKLLGANPSDARTHLSLANLYSQQLQQPGLAREHYQRVLELNPRHPEAAKIRFWLTANP